MKIVVASQNPVKIAAAKHGFERAFSQDITVSGCSVPSGVSDQPMSDSETLQGARNRALAAKQAMPAADYWLGIEGGIEDEGELMASFTWVVIVDANDVIGQARTSQFYLPPPVARLIRDGKELGEADDIVFKQDNSKQAGGAVGLLTGNVITRADYYEEAVIFSLIPFRNPDLYR